MDRIARLTDALGGTIGSTDEGVTVSKVTGWDRSAPLKRDRVDRWGHGSLSGTATRKGRSYTLEGRCSGLGHDEMEPARQYVRALFSDLQDGALEVTDFGGVVKVATVHLDGEVLADDSYDAFGFFNWQIPLWADDPYRYGEARRVFLQPVGSGIGLEYSLFTKGGILTYGSAVNATTTLTNAGDAPAYPVFDVQVDDPSGFRIVMDGRVVEYGGPCVPGTPVTVDMAGKVTVAGSGMGFMLRRREWAAIPPGGSSTATLETLQGGAGSAWATVRDTWI